MNDAFWNSHKLGESTGATIVSTGNSKHVAVVAKVDFSTPAIMADAAKYRGIESDPVAF